MQPQMGPIQRAQYEKALKARNNLRNGANLREMTALQTRVAELEKENEELRLALEDWRDIKRAIKKRGHPGRNVTRAVEVVSGIAQHVLTGNSRASYFSHWRKVQYYLMRYHAKLSWSDIARLCNRNHATVITGCKKVEQDLGKYSEDIERARVLL